MPPLLFAVTGLLFALCYRYVARGVWLQLAPLLVLLPGADGWGGAVVCPTGKPCQICNCIRTRIFDPCNPHAVERFSGQPFGGCSRECQGM